MLYILCSLKQALDPSTCSEHTEVVKSCSLPKGFKVDCSLPYHWKENSAHKRYNMLHLQLLEVGEEISVVLRTHIPAL